MKSRDVLEKTVEKIPTVSGPKQHVQFRTKLFWTVAMLVLYFIMVNVPIFGLAEDGSADFLGQFRGILAGEQGSIFHLGIIPIVTASIVLQIISGTGILPLDFNDPRDRKFYQGIRRGLIILVVMVNAFPLVFGGGFLPGSPILADTLGIPVWLVEFLIFLQITIGGIMIFYMDQIVSKWGIGSGLGLFILAGVSQRFVGGIFTELIPGWWSIVTGQVDLSFSIETAQLLLIEPGYIIPILTTFGILAIVVASELTRVEIPLRRRRTGQAQRFNIKLIYASVLPIILVRAIQANIQFIGQGLDSIVGLPSFIGQYDADGQVTGGLFFVLTPIFSPEDWMWFLGTTTADPMLILLRIIVDFTFMTVGGALFALFWIRTTNRDAGSVAKQLKSEGLRIPGFRDAPQVTEQNLNRNIPYVTALGGALIGALAVFASMLGTIGMVTGAGLLLAVSISMKMYEQFINELPEKYKQQLRHLV